MHYLNKTVFSIDSPQTHEMCKWSQSNSEKTFEKYVVILLPYNAELTLNVSHVLISFENDDNDNLVISLIYYD